MQWIDCGKVMETPLLVSPGFDFENHYTNAGENRAIELAEMLMESNLGARCETQCTHHCNNLSPAA